MTPAEYLESVKERLLSDPIIIAFQIVRERSTLADAHIRARLRLADNSQLEFSEYAQLDASGQMTIVTYSYHWTNANGDPMRRWDNTPRFPDLPCFPHHIHDNLTEDILPGRLTNINAVLNIITSQFNQQSSTQEF